LARTAERKPDDRDVQVIASTLTCALTTAARRWHAEGYRRPLEALLEEALGIPERGLTLDPPTATPE